ncbi:MAG TPA: hypothetical protein VEG38_21345 [Acidimicrobiia bacterium]|nr:hypothetical protein [Acidimicrobiia bacterium]
MPTLPLYDHTADRAEWWNFERLSQWDATHPAAAWAAHLLQEAATTCLPCPCCGRRASVRTNLDHLLRDHGTGYAEVAAWLEDADPDLFSLAVHYLAAKARAGRDPGPGIAGLSDPSALTPSRTCERSLSCR